MLFLTWSFNFLSSEKDFPQDWQLISGDFWEAAAQYLLWHPSDLIDSNPRPHAQENSIPYYRETDEGRSRLN
jgi:hypothetical protein